MSDHPSTVQPTVPEGGTAPALNPPAWSGRKVAIAAGLAVGKDFSALPVCGSVRPLADQRARRHLAT